MHVAFVTPEYALVPPFGGIATYTRDAARWLAAHGHRVKVIVVTRNGEVTCVEDQGVQVHFVPPRRIKPRRLLRYAAMLPGLRMLREAYCGWDLLEDSLGAWRAFARLNRSEQFDIVEVADVSGVGFWGAGNPRMHTPLLVRSHGYAYSAIPGWTWEGLDFQLALERYTIQHADFVLTASVERAAHYRSEYGIPPDRIGSLPYGIDLTCYPARSAAAGKPSSCIRLLYLGRVERRKGCDVLLDALRLVHESTSSLQVTVVGSVAQDMQESFAAFMEESRPWVTYVGPVSQHQVIDYLAQSDMIVLPSRFETLPRVLIEALAVGIPQIATPANGIPEIVEHGVTGLLVNPLTPQNLASAIQTLIDSPKLRSEMGLQSQARAWAKFDIEQVMPLQVEVYQALLERQAANAILAGALG